MKKPEEYLNKVTAITSRDELNKIGRQMQIDAYNKALEDAAGNAVAKEDPDDYGTGEIWVDKESILKLKINI